MRDGSTLLLSCLLLMAAFLPLTLPDASPLGDKVHSMTSDMPTRGKIDWVVLTNGTWASHINASTSFSVHFDNMNGTLEGSTPYDPYFDHNATVRKAIDAAPRWLNDTLSWKFSEFSSFHGNRLANLLLNDSVDWRYRDEIAFTIAHLPTAVLSSTWVWPELLIENVEMIYKVAEEVRYAYLTDINTSDGLRTTITYNVPNGTMTLPDEIYYEYLVMPRNSLEQPNYMNRTTRSYTYPGDGWFWRTFLYYEADPGYPVLRGSLMNQTTLWNGTRNGFESNGAVGAVTKWEMSSMTFGMPELDRRSSQPVLAYGEHIGMCGENSYLLTAVAKTALIPTVTVINFDAMHGWNMFYDRGWHVWRAYDGVIDDAFAEGGPGSVNVHTAMNPDSTQFSSAYLHTQTANITVGVKDANGMPVDGASVRLYSYPASNYDYGYGLIGNHTDALGETGFEVGYGFPYYVQILSPIGKNTEDMASIPLAVPDAVPGSQNRFNVTLNTTMPLEANLTRMTESKIGVRFNATLLDIDQSTRSFTDPMSYGRWTWKGYPDRSILRMYIVDDENLTLYRNGSEFFPAGILNLTPSGDESVILTDDHDWHVIISGLSSPLTRTFAEFSLSISRSNVTPEAVILSPGPGAYLFGEELYFSGELDPYPSYLGEVQYLWFVNGSSEPIHQEADFNWTPDVGNYLVTFSVWKENTMISSDNVTFQVVHPNRPPVASISSPEDGTVVLAGTSLLFGSNGTYDPDGDILAYEWTIPSTGTFLSDQPSFGRKLIVGDHTIRLKVTDPGGLSSHIIVNISVIIGNTRPIPNILSPANHSNHYEDELLKLSANGSYDLEGDELSFLWTSDKDGELSAEKEVNVHLSLGLHILTLVVTDGDLSSSAYVEVSIDPRPLPVNERPVAVISSPGDGDSFHVRELIVFNSDGSFDPEGAPVSLIWSVNGINVSTSVSFAMYLHEGIHSISLRVSDGDLSTAGSITIIVTNRPPVLSILMNGTPIMEQNLITVIENDTLVFDASSSLDPDGGSLTFRWALDNMTVGTGPVLTISMTRGYHELKLTLEDGEGRSVMFVQGFNCILSIPPDGEGPTDDHDDGKLPLALYLVPTFLIVLFLSIAIIFFLLSRPEKDVFFEE
ncbi:MAG: PKD domain-containing protein [Candidatus Thermoplasmatota archaeon]|nr:PKD domain-containing protein [Candidatus Thermoplasmatota archaeon]